MQYAVQAFCCRKLLYNVCILQSKLALFMIELETLNLKVEFETENWIDSEVNFEFELNLTV